MKKHVYLACAMISILFVGCFVFLACNQTPEQKVVKKYDVLIDSDLENGVITAYPVKAKEGETVYLTVEAYSGYKLKIGSLSVTGDSSAPFLSGDDPEFTFIMPGENVTVSAEFILASILPYSITLNNASSAEVIMDKEEAYSGDTVTITLVPDKTDYIHIGVTLSVSSGTPPVLDGSGLVWTFTMPSRAVTVTAYFLTEAESPHTMSYQSDETGHWEVCTWIGGCDHQTAKESHNIIKESVPKTEWTDGYEDEACDICGYSLGRTNDYVTGFGYETGAAVSRITRAEELTLTPNVNGNASMTLRLRMQLAVPSPQAQTASFHFAAPRETLMYRDHLGDVAIAAAQRTFTFETELSEIFIPGDLDSYAIYVHVSGVEQEITMSGLPTTTVGSGDAQRVYINGLHDVSNDARFLYTIRVVNAANSALRFFRDADASVDPWAASNILLASEAGRTIITVSGRAFANGSNSSDTTLPRTFRVWLTREDQPSEQFALSTGANLSTSADTRDFTIKMDVTDLESSGDWYKFVVGIDEGNGELPKMQTAGTPTSVISNNGTERNFCNGNTASGDGVITANTVDGIRCVSAWSQVHVRR